MQTHLQAVLRIIALIVAVGYPALSGCGEPVQEATSGSVPAAQSNASGEQAADLPRLRIIPAFPKLTHTFKRPVFITPAGDGSDRLYVVEQQGRIRTLDGGSEAEQAPVFLDIVDRVYISFNEEGLLSLAFHPQFSENRQFYVYYTAKNPRRGVLARYTVSSDNPDVVDPSTEEVILEVEQPWANHNGATILFGPDGYLYLSLGDGGAANDPRGHGQDLSTLLGTILRIDIDRTEGDKQYAVPQDNPFVDREGARPEIWAYGLRNVWRMSFDRTTGDLWGGDVGQNRWEEIDLITKGGNYGWNIREGAHPFREGTSPDPLIDPIAEYSRDKGISVTGGYVYRGSRHPDLQGVYIYADYVSGRFWGLRYENGEVVAHREMLHDPQRAHVASFGEDKDGELFICCFDRVDGMDGTIYRLVQE